MRWLLLLLILPSLTGCSGQESSVDSIRDKSGDESISTSSPNASVGDKRLNNKTLSKSELLNWLESAGSETVLLPVVLKSGPLGISSARIGSSPQETNENFLELSLDDSGMGISLHDSIRQFIDSDSDTCVVWLQGRAGTLLPVPRPAKSANDDSDQPFAFTVFKVTGKVEDEFAQPKQP